MQQYKNHTILILALMLFGFEASAQQAPFVKVANAVTTEMSPIRMVAAYSKAKFITTIKAESSGRVVEIASIGQMLDQGQPLGLIADEEYALRLTELTSEITSQQAQVDYLQSESKRLLSLESKNLTSATALDKNKADLQTAIADLSQAKSRLQQLESNISKLTPKAPFNAFVTKQLAQPGQFLNQGQDLLEIMSSNDIEIIAQLPFKLKFVILPGAIWSYEDQMGNKYEAEIERFIPAATSSSRLIEVHLKDLSEALLPGEPVKLHVPASLPQQLTAVPRDALVLRRQGAYVFVIKDNVAHKVEVETSLAQGDMIAVIGDIKPGDVVVIRGNERLRDQQTVQIMP